MARLRDGRVCGEHVILGVETSSAGGNELGHIMKDFSGLRNERKRTYVPVLPDPK